jgi:hypothetical protein
MKFRLDYDEEFDQYSLVFDLIHSEIKSITVNEDCNSMTVVMTDNRVYYLHGDVDYSCTYDGRAVDEFSSACLALGVNDFMSQDAQFYQSDDGKSTQITVFYTGYSLHNILFA